MSKKNACFLVFLFSCGSLICRADFKYTESSKITGGALANMMKVAGVFSKKATEPIVTTTYIKGTRMRTDEPEGRFQLVDLDGRRIIGVDTRNRTYTVLTFDEMRAAIEKFMQEGPSKEMKIKPKFEINPTGNTRVILGQTTREVKVKMEMEMEAQDPKKQKEAQSVTFEVNADMWIAPSVPGYGEFRKFFERMSKEIGWVPGAKFGGDPKMAQAMLEMRKNAASLEGIPLMQFTTLGVAGMAMPPPEAAAGQAEQAGQAENAGATAPSQPEQPQAPSVKDAAADAALAKASPKAAMVKKLGGMFGGFGRKKKQQQQEQQEQQTEEQSSASTSSAESQPAAAPPPPVPASGSPSFAEMTSEVTSFSTDPLDASLFEIPAGYKEVKESAEKVLGGRR